MTIEREHDIPADSSDFDGLARIFKLDHGRFDITNEDRWWFPYDGNVTSSSDVQRTFSGSRSYTV